MYWSQVYLRQQTFHILNYKKYFVYLIEYDGLCIYFVIKPTKIRTKLNVFCLFQSQTSRFEMKLVFLNCLQESKFSRTLSWFFFLIISLSNFLTRKIVKLYGASTFFLLIRCSVYIFFYFVFTIL